MTVFCLLKESSLLNENLLYESRVLIISLKNLVFLEQSQSVYLIFNWLFCVNNFSLKNTIVYFILIYISPYLFLHLPCNLPIFISYYSYMFRFDNRVSISQISYPNIDIKQIYLSKYHEF